MKNSESNYDIRHITQQEVIEILKAYTDSREAYIEQLEDGIRKIMNLFHQDCGERLTGRDSDVYYICANTIGSIPLPHIEKPAL